MAATTDTASRTAHPLELRDFEAVRPGVRAWLIARPGLFELVNTGERVVLVSAPAGSGKTFLLRSWIAAEGLGDRVAWVSVGREEHDALAFWLSVLDSLRGTRVGSGLVRELTAAPDLDGGIQPG
jgi:LuxR family maltose regulon positive regulatory protein